MSDGPVLNYATPLRNHRSWLGQIVIIAGLLISGAVIASRMLDGIVAPVGTTAASPPATATFSIVLATADMAGEVFVCPSTLSSDRGFRPSDAVARSHHVPTISFQSPRPAMSDVVFRDSIYPVRPAPPATRPSAEEDTLDTILLPADE